MTDKPDPSDPEPFSVSDIILLVVFALFMFLPPSCVHADDLDLVVSGRSWHGRDGMNGDNRGLGLQYTRDAFGAGLGFYDNSEGRQTRYAVGMWLPLHPVEVLRLGVVAGMFDGYAGTPGAPQPPATVKVAQGDPRKRYSASVETVGQGSGDPSRWKAGGAFLAVWTYERVGINLAYQPAIGGHGWMVAMQFRINLMRNGS